MNLDRNLDNNLHNFIKKHKNNIIFILWIILVTAWNFLYQQATPLEDVLVAVVLSLLSSFFKD